MLNTGRKRANEEMKKEDFVIESKLDILESIMILK